MANTDTLATIDPLRGPLVGSTRVPGDKSISHRAVLFSAMAEGTSTIRGVLDSADVQSSISAIKALGAQVSFSKDEDGSLAGSITGWGSEGPEIPDGSLDCGNSGTTARLLMGVLSPWNIKVSIDGDDSLRKRPMRRITAPLMKMGVRFEPAGQETLPIKIQGTQNVKAIDYSAPMASAQLKTAVLLAGVYAKGTTTVHEPSPSRNHTELMLPEYGVHTTAAPGLASVEGPVKMKACDMQVPGDPSSAAYLVCAAALKRGSILEIEQVSLNPARIGFMRTLERMGVEVEAERTGSEGKEPIGTLRVKYCANLRGCEIPADKIPTIVDEVPVLALVAAHAKGVTVFRQIEELRVKETDRIEAILEGLEQIGVDAWIDGNDLFVEGQADLEIPKALVFDSHNDHRIAMTWAVLGLTGSQPVTVKNFDSVKISYPHFLSDFERLMK